MVPAVGRKERYNEGLGFRLQGLLLIQAVGSRVQALSLWIRL